MYKKWTISQSCNVVTGKQRYGNWEIETKKLVSLEFEEGEIIGREEKTVIGQGISR